MRHTTAILPRLAAALADCRPEERALIGVSGGADSVALLQALHELGYRKLIVCHLHHGLRGRAAEADARFVERLAEQLGCPCVVERADVKTLAKTQQLSLETAGRHARREFFQRVARRRRCGTLFLAHHADDQAETFLFNLLRGAGLGGLSGMQSVSTLGKLRIIRPLLGIWRAEILAWLAERGCKFREDATNLDPRHTRNRLRHEIIPLLEKSLARPVRSALWRAADIASAENAYLAAQTPNFPPGPLPLARIRALPRVLARRALLAWLRGEGVAEVGFAEIELAWMLLQPGEKVARANLAGDRFLRRRAGFLFVE